MKNSKSTHPIILIFSLLLTLSLILPHTANSNPPVKIGAINNDSLVNMEDVVTENSTLRDRVKVSTQYTLYIRETGDTITGDITYYWFYKSVKESSLEGKCNIVQRCLMVGNCGHHTLKTERSGRRRYFEADFITIRCE